MSSPFLASPAPLQKKQERKPKPSRRKQTRPPPRPKTPAEDFGRSLASPPSGRGAQRSRATWSCPDSAAVSRSSRSLRFVSSGSSARAPPRGRAGSGGRGGQGPWIDKARGPGEHGEKTHKKPRKAWAISANNERERERVDTKRQVDTKSRPGKMAKRKSSRTAWATSANKNQYYIPCSHFLTYTRCA